MSDSPSAQRRSGRFPRIEPLAPTIGRLRAVVRPRATTGTPIPRLPSPATFSGAWRDWAKAHGLDGITFHGLRHGAATLLLAAGVSDTVAMRTMGHADTRILARYQDVVSELQRDAAARMDQLLGQEGAR